MKRADDGRRYKRREAVDEYKERESKKDSYEPFGGLERSDFCHFEKSPKHASQIEKIESTE